LKPPASYRIAIAPLGDFDPQLPETVSREIHRVRLARRGQGDSTEPGLHHGAGDSNTIRLDSAEACQSPDDALRVLAWWTNLSFRSDLYDEIGGKACIVSTCRLNDGSGARYLSEKTAWRVVKESLHELGHTFNLRHCPDPVCLMHYCRGDADVDRKSGDLCRYCRVILDDELRRIVKRGQSI
jgi:archaemetzincin